MPPSPVEQPLIEPTINLRRRIYELLVSEKRQGSALPSQDDIRRIFGAVSEDVDLHLEQLAREGLLVLDRDGGNGISLVPTYVQLPEIGILGKVARQFSARSGHRQRASIGLDLRGVNVPIPPGIQAVLVLDDRMIDADIQYGDIALIVHSTPIAAGDIVAVDEGQVVVLRRYVVVSGIPHFLAENSKDPALSPAWNQDVYGVLWGLIRVEQRQHLRSAAATHQKQRKSSAHHGLTGLSMENVTPGTRVQADPPKQRTATALSKRQNSRRREAFSPSLVSSNGAESNYQSPENHSGHDHRQNGSKLRVVETDTKD